jgi:hypothetical protein
MPDEQTLLNAIDAHAERAYGSNTDSGELARQRSLALDAFLGKNIEPAPVGRSQVVDQTVFETVQWILPSLTRIFAGGDDVVEFEPVGPEDEPIAEQESMVLNHLVTQKNNWFLTCLEWFQDALITKNAYCYVYMEEKLVPEVERYEGQSEDQLALLMQDDVEIVSAEQRVDEDNPDPVLDPMTGEQMIDPMTGQPVFMPRMIYDVEVKRTKPKKNLKFMVLPPENCRISEDTTDFTLRDCPYFEYFEEVTISELRKQGYDVPDDIADDAQQYRYGLEERARDEIYDLRHRTRTEQNPVDPAMRLVRARTIWIQHDYDEDGIAELQKVVRVANTILDMEPASRIPVASIVPFLNTHRHIGTSVADLTFDIQRIKTSMLRSGMDSLHLATRPRHAASNKVNLDDLMQSVPGGIVQIDTGQADVQGHITPLPTENVFPYAQQGLEHMDRVVEARVGVNRMFQGIDESSMNDYNRIGQLSTMASQRIEQIARIFANGIEYLFEVAHELVIKSGHQMEAIKLRGNWMDIDPTQWRTGRDLRVVAPFAAGNKDSLLQRLMILKNIHSEAAAAGHPMVQLDDSYNLALEIASAADLMGVKYFTDPATIPPPEPGPDYTAAALQIEDKKVDNEAVDEERQAELDKYRADLDAQVKQYQVDVHAQTQLALADIKNGSQVDLERLKAGLKVKPIDVDGKNLGVSDAFGSLQAAQEQMALTLNTAVATMADALAKANGPKRVVRENGQIVGVEPVDS